MKHLLTVLLIAALSTGLVACAERSSHAAPGEAPADQPAVAAPPPVQRHDDQPAEEAATAPEPAPAAASFAPYESGGWRLLIPAIGVDHPIVALGLEPDGALAAPTGPDEVGWYQYGPAPGSQGNVLLDGHVDWTDRSTGRPRGAVFYQLRSLGAGSQIIFTDGNAQAVYQVTEHRRYRFDDPAGVEVLQPTDDSRLTLITCGGTFDRSTRSYDQRDVVIALRVS